MRTPQELSREELEQVANATQQALYLSFDADSEGFAWDPDKEWRPADVCETLAGTLSMLGLVPEDRLPFQPLS